MDIKKDSNDTIFTIIIPTRERSDTLVHTLRTALAQDYEHFEVLVSDNASQDDTAEKVDQIKDSRLRYVNTGHRVSMSENWEFALNHVESGWVTVLGDDDAILPGALRRANEIIKKTGLSAIRSNGCSYQWPGFGGSKYGSLTVSLRRGYEIRSSGDMLQQVLDGRRYYTELPMLYNGGFVSLDLISRAKSITGNFFQSMTPDVYSAIVFSLLTESYVYSIEPLAINGASLHSTGTAGFEKVKQKRSYDPAEKFWNEKNIPFHEDLPLMKTGRPVRSISVCVYEAFLQAKEFHGFKQVHTSHQKQLEIALKTSGPDPAEINEWVELFRRKNDLKPKSMPAKAKTSLRLDKFFSRILSLLHSCRFKGNQCLSLSNVYDAAIVAGFIKTPKPSVLKNIIHTLYIRVRNA
jgi:hypothetical protein